MEMTSREVIIGTSEPLPHGAEDGTDAAAMGPSIAEVEAHLSQLRLAFCGHANSTAAYGALVQLPALEQERISRIADLLDQVRAWAVEESLRGEDHPSLLAQAEAPEAVVAALLCGRPRVILQGLRIAEQMLHHRQSRSELQQRLRDAATVDGDDDSARHSSWLPCVVLLCSIMRQSPGMAMISAGCIAVATSLLPLTRQEPFLTRDIMESQLLELMLSAMQRHEGIASVQSEATRFYAALVSAPFLVANLSDSDKDGEDDQGSDEEDAEAEVGRLLPLAASYIAHDEATMSQLLRTLNRHWYHLSIRRAVIHVCCVGARSPENRIVLMQVGAYAVLVRLLHEVGPYTPDILAELAETIGYFIPQLDVVQQWSLLLLLQHKLRARGDVATVTLTLALVAAVLAVLYRHGGSGGGAFHMYSLYPTPAAETAEHHSRRTTQLCLSDLQWHPNTHLDQRKYLVEQTSIPQLVSGILQYFHNAEAVDEAEAVEMDRLSCLAKAILRYF